MLPSSSTTASPWPRTGWRGGGSASSGSTLRTCRSRRWTPAELRKVFMNLVLNGLDAMGDEGTLTVAVTHQSEEIQVTIEDTGCGMSDETLSRAFDLFFTTKPHGTGLGMAIARSVVDLHGGQIQIDSRLGQGTHVRVLLPVRQP